MAELVKVDYRDGVAVLTLDHAERRNTLSPEMIAGIVAGVAEVEASDASALVVAANGPAFCGGADLGDLAKPEASPEVKAAALRGIYAAFLAVARCPLPTVAAVQGAAVGAGLNMALCCDVRFVTDSTKWVPRFGELGLHPGGGNTWMLDRLGGPQTAAAMTLFNTPLRGADIMRLGMAWDLVAEDQLLETAVAFARGATASPRALLIKMKETLTSVPSITSHDAAVEAEIVPQVWSVTTGDFLDRIAALTQRIQKK